jgi:hypothetical protein
MIATEISDVGHLVVDFPQQFYFDYMKQLRPFGLVPLFKPPRTERF